MQWLARDEAGMPADLSWLTAGEAAYAAGLRYTKRYTEYLLRRWVAKHAVAAATGRPADPATFAGIEVRNASSGAPRVYLDGAPLGVDVSISDRAGWAVCLVGSGAEGVGCDLELVEPRSAGFVTDVLTPAERRYVADQPDETARYAATNLMWSAKESALKVLRTGLRRDTRTVEVRPGPATRGRDGWAPLSVHAAEGTVMPGWWRRDGCFLLTVAGTVAFPPPVAIEDPAVLATAEPRHSWLERPRRQPDRDG